MKFLKWLYPGLGIKRWFLIGVIGLILLSTGMALLLHVNIVNYMIKMIYEAVYNISGTLPYHTNIIVGVLLIIVSISMLIYAGNRFINKLNREVYKSDDFVNVLYKKNQ